MGGDTDPAKVKITEGDVTRVAQPYSKPDGSSGGLQSNGNWGGQKHSRLKVKHRGFEMVVGPPRPANGSGRRS